MKKYEFETPKNNDIVTQIEILMQAKLQALQRGQYDLASKLSDDIRDLEKKIKAK